MVIDDADMPKSSVARDPAADLLAQVAAGDETARARIYDLLGARVYGVIDAAMPGHGEELLQQVFLDAWASAGSFDRAKGSGEEWVLAIVQRRMPAAHSRRDDREQGPQTHLSAPAVAPPLYVRARLVQRAAHGAHAGEVPVTQSEPLSDPVEPLLAPVEPTDDPDDLTAPTRPSHDLTPSPRTSTAAVSPVESAPPTDVVQTLQRRNWIRGISIGVVASVLLVLLGWGAGELAALWQ